MKDYSYGRDRERVEELLKALKALVDRYASLVESGDCGNWDWREEDVIKQAFSAIGGADD